MKPTIFINHTNDTFGAEQVLLYILQHQSPSQVLVVEPAYRTDSDFARRVNEMGLPILRLKYKNLGGSLLRSILVMLYNLPAVWRLSRLVKQEKYEVVYSNTSKTCLGAQLAWFCGIQHIWHIHETCDIHHDFLPHLSVIYRWLLKYASTSVRFVTNQQAEQWKRYFHIPHYRVVYNPIMVDNQSCCPGLRDESALWIGHLGSHSVRKNIPFLIRALAQIRQNGVDARLLLSRNRGDDNDAIQLEIDRLGMQAFVTEVDVANPMEFYARLHVLVLPSLAETWGMVATEAMYCGVPVIITKNSGLFEVIGSGQEALSVDPFDISSLQNALTLISDESVRNRMSEAGIRWAKQWKENYDRDSIVNI